MICCMDKKMDKKTHSAEWFRDLETIKFSLDGIDCEYVYDLSPGINYAELYSSCYFKNGEVYEPSKEELKRLVHHAFNSFYYPFEQHEKN